MSGYAAIAGLGTWLWSDLCLIRAVPNCTAIDNRSIW